MKLQSPINRHTQVRFDGVLPEAADVVVIGGGIIGMATAYELAQQGLDVVVCEKGRVGCEQSSRNWGWVRQTGRDAAELPIMMESIHLWQELAAKTRQNALVFQQQGVTYLANDRQAMEKHEAFAALAKQHGLTTSLLSGDQLGAHVPSAKRTWHGGIHTSSDGRVEPWTAVPALSAACIDLGVSVRENCAVRSIDETNGVVTGVTTELGAIRAERVLLAGGAWSSLLARKVAINLPQLSVKATVARVDSIPDIGHGNASDRDLAWCKRSDGGYNIALPGYHEFYPGPDAFRHLKIYQKGLWSSWSQTHFRLNAPEGFPDSWRLHRTWSESSTSPFERHRILDPKADAKLVNRMLGLLKTRFEGCDAAKATHAWAGMIDTMPDFVPVMDQVESLPGLFIATGFSGHGFGIAPAAGKVMAKLMQQHSPGHDISRFRLSRFSDGSEMELGPH